MRERLIELIYEWETLDHNIKISDYDSDESLARLADHLLANGVIVPPCKVGDTVYCIFEDNNGEEYITEKFVTEVLYRYNGLRIRCGFSFYALEDIGVDLFFSREEAEKALRERGEKS